MQRIDHHCPKVLAPLVLDVAIHHAAVALPTSANCDSEVALAAVAMLAGLVVLLRTSEANELVAPLVPTRIILTGALIFATLAEN